MASNGIFTTEFRMTLELDSFEFIREFEANFTDGRAIPAGVADGFSIFHLRVPRGRKSEVKPFIDAYAGKNRGETVWKLV